MRERGTTTPGPFSLADGAQRITDHESGALRAAGTARRNAKWQQRVFTGMRSCSINIVSTMKRPRS